MVAARDEAATIAVTLAGLGRAAPGARLWVADDGSRDATAALARRAGATVVSSGTRRGKGQAMTGCVRAALDAEGAGADDAMFVLCDADLGESAALLGALAAAAVVAPGRAGAQAGERMAVAVFARPRGGGFGIALGFARLAVRRRAGLRLAAPMSGQRALRGRTLRAMLPFAEGFGMELGMSLDAARAGVEIAEVRLDLAHRARGRTPAGFAHRARQLAGMVRAFRRR